MKTAKRILLVEDDPNLGSLLSEYLSVKGFDVSLATDGERGFSEFKRHEFDFIVLDVMMPKKDGFTLAKEIRQMNEAVPILFLTAKTMKEDTLQGFKSGGDDYMTKPFSMEVLTARINAILKRSETKVSSEFDGTHRVGLFEFDPEKRTLLKNGETTSLTTKEKDLLLLLSKKRNEVLERNHALNAIWGDDSYHNGRSMDVYITKLRKHLKSDTDIEIINVHGKGFKLLVP